MFLFASRFRRTMERMQSPVDIGGLGDRPDFAAAAAYAEAHGGLGFYAERDGETVFEKFPAYLSADEPHPIASGSKSLVAAAVAAAVADGLLGFDEPAAATLSEWHDPLRAQITVRHLLGMCSGLKLGHNLPYAKAVRLGGRRPPGLAFSYNPANYEVLGELLRRKLGGDRGQPLAYIQGRLLDRIGVHPAGWYTNDADPRLAGGAVLSARDWARFGRLLLAQGRSGGDEIVPAAVLAQLHAPSPCNPYYGLGFWRNALRPRAAAAGHPLRDAYMAAGLGGQRLLLFPALNLLIVRQARLLGTSVWKDPIGGHGFGDGEFISALFPP
jgi:CubicO group peptidase (beta-lactamase class C family)